MPSFNSFLRINNLQPFLNFVNRGGEEVGQINMNYRFLSNEDMMPSGVYVNNILDEMAELAQQLNRLVDGELQYAKGEIVEKVLSEVGERTVEQLNICGLQKYFVTMDTRQYNDVYNDIAVQPITITYRLKKKKEAPLLI